MEIRKKICSISVFFFKVTLHYILLKVSTQIIHIYFTKNNLEKKIFKIYWPSRHPKNSN